MSIGGTHKNIFRFPETKTSTKGERSSIAMMAMRGFEQTRGRKWCAPVTASWTNGAVAVVRSGSSPGRSTYIGGQRHNGNSTEPGGSAGDT